MAVITGVAATEIESVDNFAYEPGTVLLGRSGGAGFSGPWTQVTETFFDPTHSGERTFIRVAEGALEYPNLEVPGNRVVFEGAGAPDSPRFETLARKTLHDYQSGAVVFSYLLRAEDVAAVKYSDVQIVGTNESIRIHFDSTGQIFVNGEPTKGVISSGKTHLILGRIENQVDGDNDLLRVWVDPDLKDFSDPSYVSNNRDFGTINRISLEAQSSKKVEWDAMRVATAKDP